MYSRIFKDHKYKKLIAPLDTGLLDDPEENPEDYEDPEVVVNRAEERAREEQNKTGAKRNTKIVSSKQKYAEALYRQADRLHHRGNYEPALVLYHRAAKVYPRESSHGVAARRTSAAITLATNPSKALKRALSVAKKNPSQLAAYFCPETAALRAKKIVEESSDPVSAINQILKYFDSRKDFSQSPPIFQDRQRSSLLSRSKIMLRQLSGLANSTLNDLQVASASGDLNRSLKIGDQLLVIAETLPNRYRYQVAAHHYLAMTQIALGRHDRAVNQVSKMVRLAGESGDVGLWSRSMMTLGRVHLSFRHFEAAARAWEKLVLDVDEAIPKAWLLHEIGRCYFEMKRYTKALETAGRCIEYADEGNSRKWLLHGKLLGGQSLVELGRFGEAVGALKIAANAARDEQDFDTHEYISNLIEQVTKALREVVFYDQAEQEIPTPAENSTRRAKSDDALTKQICLPKKSEEMQKPKTSTGRYFTIEMKAAQSTVLKNSGRSQRGRRNIRKTRPCRLPISSLRESGTFHEVQEDICAPESVTQTIKPLERFPYEDNLSSRLDDPGDEQMLTSRTRVIRREEIGNSTDESEIGGYEETTRSIPDDDEKSNRTGKTYVLRESGNLEENRSIVTSKDKDFESNIENKYFDENYTQEGDEETDDDDDEYLKNIERANNEISSGLYVDEEKEDKEEEEGEEEEEEKEDKEVENDDEDGKDFFLHREISSLCESKFSPALTRRTYVIEEKKSSMCDMASCYVDNEKKMIKQKIYNSLIPPRCEFPTNIAEDTIQRIADSSRYKPEGHSNFIRVANLLAEQTPAESEEKFNGSSRTSSLAEHSEMNSPETLPFLEQLDTRKSISSRHSYGSPPTSTRQRPLSTYSLPTSPRNELVCQYSGFEEIEPTEK